MQPDFVITNMGTTVLIRPVTGEAKLWVEENVDVQPWQRLGDSFAVDHRPGWYLVDLIEDSGQFVTEIRHPAAA